jgi:hypothetical protein
MNSVQKRLFTLALSALLFAGLGIDYAAAGGKSDSSAAPKQLVMCYLPNEASEELA